MQLRKICQHPFLFESVEDNVNPGGYINDLLVRTSGTPAVAPIEDLATFFDGVPPEHVRPLSSSSHPTD